MRHPTLDTNIVVPNTSPHPSSRDWDTPEKIANSGNWKRSSWLFYPNDVSPLQWWRSMPADHLDDARHLLLRSTMEKIHILNRKKWLGDLHGDAAACIAIALGSLPVATVTLEIDLTMSALAIHALGGNAASALILSHILRLVPLDHPFARELSVSWLILNLRRALEAKTNAVSPHHEIANCHLVDHGTCLRTGDIS